ncbi:MAG: putative porin [Candidatus Omnitrophica bacterium]|nr:putative porin [Candidatus Omnitrophota bacterium]
MKKRFLTIIVAVLFLGLASLSAQAGEIDILLNKLVEKGILTAGEAQQIGTETKEQIKADIAKGTDSSLPSWVQTIKLKGDFRARYQLDHTAKSHADQNRGRVRLRLGMEAKANDKLNVGIGLATGKDDATAIDKDTARSTNQTLGNGFSKHPITLDYAYAQYTPLSWSTITVGKFKNVLWEPGDLIWDTDINPEGGALQLSGKFNSNLDWFINSGVLILDENSGDGDDPTMYVTQGGTNFKFNDKVSLKSAVSFYTTSGVKNRALDGTVGTNSKDSLGNLLNEYDTITPALELTIVDPFKALNVGFLDIPQISLFGEYVTNPRIKDGKNANGYMGGVKFGAAKIANKGDWQAQYNYGLLQKDAVLDILPDSDRMGGKTDMFAHEAIFQYGLGKNTYLALDYYQGRVLHGTQSARQIAHVVQVDWNVKF